jgi:hypothetical protein
VWFICKTLFRVNNEKPKLPSTRSETWVRSHGIPRRICGGNYVTGTGFALSRLLRFLLSVTIPTLLQTHTASTRMDANGVAE